MNYIILHLNQLHVLRWYLGISVVNLFESTQFMKMELSRKILLTKGRRLENKIENLTNI